MLTNVFGLPIKYDQWNREETLPLYIIGHYDIHVAHIMNQRCIMIKPKEELATLPALKKHINKIKSSEHVPIILELDNLSSYRKKSLIENNIPFITQKQLFLPFIGTLLTKKEESSILVNKLTYSAQQLLLFYLYSHTPKLYASDCKVLPFTAMTLSRAVKQLEATELFLITKEGVNTVIESKYSYKELFEKSQKYLSNPIKTRGYIEKSQITKEMVLSGESVLSKKTMLNSNKLMDYAISEKKFDKKKLKNELIDPDEQVALELWAYDPKLLSNDNMADTLSVVLSLRDNNDERVEEAVEKIIEREL